MSTLGAGVVPPVSTILSGVPERQGQSLRDPGGQTSSVLVQMGRLSTPPQKKKGEPCPGSQKEWIPGTAPTHQAFPPLGFPPRLQAGSWEAEAASCPGASGRAEREGRHHPHPRRGHTWALRAGGGRGPAPGSSESGPPPRAAPWGPPDGPAARPATQAGNGRRGCQGRGRELRGRGPPWDHPLKGGAKPSLRGRPACESPDSQIRSR